MSLNVFITLDTLIVERITIRFCKTLTFRKHDKMIDNMQQPEARKCLLGEEVNAEDKILISYLLGVNQRMKVIRNSKLDAVCPAIIIFTRRSKESRIDQDRGVLIVI